MSHPAEDIVNWGTFAETRTVLGEAFVRVLGYFREDGIKSVAAIEQAMRERIAAIGRSARRLAKDSVVETSTSICEGRSARDHTMALSVLTSPDCTPCGISGRSAARRDHGDVGEPVDQVRDPSPADPRAAHPFNPVRTGARKPFVG